MNCRMKNRNKLFRYYQKPSNVGRAERPQDHRWLIIYQVRFPQQLKNERQEIYREESISQAARVERRTTIGSSSSRLVVVVVLTCCQNWARISGPCDLVVVNQSKDSIGLQRSSHNMIADSKIHTRRRIKTIFDKFWGFFFPFFCHAAGSKENTRTCGGSDVPIDCATRQSSPRLISPYTRNLRLHIVLN